MYCSKCNYEIVNNERFCPNCGNNLNVSEVIQQSKSVDSAPAEPVEPAAQQEQTPENSVVQTNYYNNSEMSTLYPDNVAPASTVYSYDTVAGKTSPKKESKVIKNILSVLCCLFVALLTLLIVSVFSFRGSITTENVSNMFDDIDIEVLLDEQDISSAIKIDIDKYELAKIYEEGTYKSFLKGKLIECSEYILDGTEPKNIYAEDIEDLMSENEEVIEDVLGHKLSEADYEVIEEMAEDIERDHDLNIAVSLVKKFCSILIIIAMIVFAIALVGLLFVVRKKSYDVLLWVGATISVVALLFTLMITIITFLSGSILGLTGEIEVMAVDLYLSNSIGVFLMNSGILLAIGAILIISYIIIKKVKSRKTVA